MKNKAKDIFPLWDIEMTGEFRKKVPVVVKNDQPAKAPIPRVQFGKKRGRKKKPPIVLPDAPSKTCVICGNIFYRTRLHTDERWEKLEICTNRSCWGKYAKSHVKRSGPISKKFPPKTCIVCDKIFHKPYAVAAEVWEKQQTCSKTCAGMLLSQRAASEDDSEPATIAINPRIKISNLAVSIPEIVLVELQNYAVKNNVSTSDVALVAMIEFLLAVKPDDRTIKTTIKKLFKKEPEANDKPTPPPPDI
jgi:hypothetical protein